MIIFKMFTFQFLFSTELIPRVQRQQGDGENHGKDEKVLKEGGIERPFRAFGEGWEEEGCQSLKPWIGILLKQIIPVWLLIVIQPVFRRELLNNCF